MRGVLALAFVAWIFTFARGLVRSILPPAQRDPLTIALTTAAFGLGLATLAPLWLMLADPGGPAFAFTLIVTLLVYLGARFVRPRDARAVQPDGAPTPRRLWPNLLSLAVIGAIGLCCTAIVFNAVYWPFDAGDALALYAPFGKFLYQTSTLPIGDRIYEAYPMLVPMSYALTHWAAGGVNESLARLVPALMAVGVIGAGGALARDVGSPRTGLVASGLIAVTPLFGRWAPTGYTDVPAALYVGLSALFAWRWWIDGESRAAWLAGIAAGLAFWTKNSTLTLLPSLVVILVSRRFFRSRAAEPRATSTWIAGGALACAVVLVAGPWYLRNVLLFGFFVPPTVLIDRAQHTIGALLVMLRAGEYFGASGWVFTAGLLYGAARLFSGDRRQSGRWWFLLAFALPYLAAWWWLASYEARFLVTLLPILATMGALAIDDLATLLEARLTPRAVLRVAIAAAAVTVIATAESLRKTVEHKTVLVRQPWLNDVERHRVQLGGLYDLARAVNALPAASRVGGVPAIIRYHLDPIRLAMIDSAPETASPETLESQYDYVAYHEIAGHPFAWQATTVPILRTADGYLLYATRRTARVPAGAPSTMS